MKNAGIRILSNFWHILSIFFSISGNLAKNYVHAQFKINWAFQTEITGGGGGGGGIPTCEKLGLFRVESKGMTPVTYRFEGWTRYLISCQLITKQIHFFTLEGSEKNQ